MNNNMNNMYNTSSYLSSRSSSSYFISIDSTYPFQKISIRKQHNIQLQRSIFIQSSNQLQATNTLLSQLNKNKIKNIIKIEQCKQCKQKVNGIEKIIFIVSYECIPKSLQEYISKIENQQVIAAIIQNVYNRVKEILIQLLMNKIIVSEVKIANIGIDPQFDIFQNSQSYIIKQQSSKNPMIKLYIDPVKCKTDDRSISFKDKVGILQQQCIKIWNELSKRIIINRKKEQLIENPESRKKNNNLILEAYVPMKYQLKPSKVLSVLTTENSLNVPQNNKKIQEFGNNSLNISINLNQPKNLQIGNSTFRESISSNFNDSINQSTMSVFTTMEASVICSHVDLTIDHSRKVLQNFKRSIKMHRKKNKNCIPLVKPKKQDNYLTL